MPKHLLPPLINAPAVTPCPNAGEWIKDNNKILGTIGESVKVASLEKKSQELISIPDVWARTAVVANALYDKKHPSHEAIQGEWRGLLSLFALLASHKQTIETKIINIPQLADNPYLTNAEVTNDSNFARVLNLIKPSAKLAHNQSWDEIGIIKFKIRILCSTCIH